jgi:NADH-quinone oxidoreductase subunit A
MSEEAVVLAEYLPIAVLFTLAALFVGLSMAVSSKLGPSRPNPTKAAPYESGIIPAPDTNVRGSRFPVKFYLIAMMFIIFDVEAVFLYPWAVTLRDLGWYGLAVMGIFVALLFESYYYILRRGGLEWD